MSKTVTAQAFLPPAAVCVLSAILVAAFSFTTDEFQYGDNCGYLTLGIAVAQGRGFTDLSIPGHPHFLWWPPGFPLFIGAFYVIFGAHWVALKVLIFGLLYAALLLFGRMLLARGHSLADTAAVLLAVSLSSAIHLLSSYLYSETFYIGVTLIFFWLFYKWHERLTIGRIAALSVLSVYVASVRNAGVSLPIALGVYLAAKNWGAQGRRWRWTALIPLAAVISYAIVVVTVPAVEVGSFQSFLGLNPQFRGALAVAVPHAGPMPGILGHIATLADKMACSLRGYGLTLIPQTLLQTAYAAYPMTKVKALCAGAVTLLVIAGWVVTVRRLALVNIYVMLYMAVLFVYGPLYHRLLVPIAPMLIVYLYAGIKGGAGLFARGQFREARGERKSAGAKTRAAAVAGALVAVLWSAVIADNAWWTFTSPRRYMPPRFGDERYQRCIAWVKQHAGTHDVVVSDIYSFVFLQRGGDNIPFHFAEVPGEIQEFFDYYHARYLMLPARLDHPELYLTTVRKMVRGDPDRFRLVYGPSIDSSCVVEYRR